MTEDDLIYDVGMHKGEDTEFYLKKGFRVVAIEAMPPFCVEATDRLRTDVDSGRLTILNGAVTDQSGPVRFYVNPKSVWGTIRPSWAKRNEDLGFPTSEMIEVPGLQFGDILQQHGFPHYLKIDIEGADLLCLEALTSTSERPHYISIESNKVSWRELVREFDLLEQLGYTRFKIVAQQRVKRQRCPRPSREGSYVDHRFAKGASGLFGDEAPGRWIGRRAALLRYRFIFLLYWLYGDQGVLRRYLVPRAPRMIQHALLRGPGWYDTHAS